MGHVFLIMIFPMEFNRKSNRNRFLPMRFNGNLRDLMGGGVFFMLSSGWRILNRDELGWFFWPHFSYRKVTKHWNLMGFVKDLSLGGDLRQIQVFWLARTKHDVFFSLIEELNMEVSKKLRKSSKKKWSMFQQTMLFFCVFLLGHPDMMSRLLRIHYIH